MLLYPMPFGIAPAPAPPRRAAGAPSTSQRDPPLQLAWGVEADSWQTESRAAFTNPAAPPSMQAGYFPAPLLVPLPPGYVPPHSGFAPPPPYAPPLAGYGPPPPGYYNAHLYGAYPTPHSLPAAPPAAPTPDVVPAAAAPAPAAATAAGAAVSASDEVADPQRPASAAATSSRARSATRRRAATARSPSALDRPIFHAYGHGNIKPTAGGYLYGDYMATHNAKAGSTLPRTPRQAAAADLGTMQMHFMEADIRRSAGSSRG